MAMRFDSIVIGTGQAGPSLAARLAQSGRRVAVIERKLFGGTCVNTGCIPTKAMVASAYAARMAQRAAEYGVAIDGRVSTDMKRVKARKDQISGESRTGVEEWLRGLDNCTVFTAHARFEFPGTVAVDSAVLSAGEILLNVGGRAAIPPISGLDGVRYLTNSSMMDVDFLPRRLVALGGGYVAVEFGQMFRRFGSEVSILERGPRLLQKAGVKTDDHGYVVVDDQLRTNVPGIWALGDCNGRGAFTHTSYNDYEIVAANLLDNDPRRVTDRIPAYAVFTDPPLGRVGMTEAEVRRSGKRALIDARAMTRVGRAVEKGESQGFMKILVDEDSKRILGASILGTGGDEAIHCIMDAMYANAPYTVVERAVHIHPTVSELIPTMLGELKPLQ